MLKSVITAAALIAAVPAAAQDAAISPRGPIVTQPVTPPTAAPAAPAGLSEEGQRILKAYGEERAAKLPPLVRKKRELDAQMTALLTPEGYDAAKLEALTAEIHEVEEQLFAAMSNSLLTLLKTLPEADRTEFLKSLRKGPAPLPAGPGR